MSGIRQISGLQFMVDVNYDAWASNPYSGIWIVLSGRHSKCFLHNLKDDLKYPFDTVVAAIAFAKRCRHGRTLEEHERALMVQFEREKRELSVKEFANLLGISSRTVESWSSGIRAVPKMAIIAISGDIH